MGENIQCEFPRADQIDAVSSLSSSNDFCHSFLGSIVSFLSSTNVSTGRTIEPDEKLKMEWSKIGFPIGGAES